MYKNDEMGPHGSRVLEAAVDLLAFPKFRAGTLHMRLYLAKEPTVEDEAEIGRMREAQVAFNVDCIELEEDREAFWKSVVQG